MDHKESPQDQIKSIIKLFSSGQTQEALVDIEALINDFPNEPLLFFLVARHKKHSMPLKS